MSEGASVWRAHGYGPARTRLRLDALPDALPANGEVRIRVEAASLNPIDYKLLHGDLRRVVPLRFPQAMGFDGAGTIDAVGPNAGNFQAGERVFVRASRETIGTFAQATIQPARFVARMPASVDFAGAASLPLVALTTVQGLVDRAQAQPGERILIHAGSGGLGSFAVQYAKWLGLRVDTTTSSRNADWVAALGADDVIAYDREDYAARGPVYDLVFDTLGGPHTQRSFDVLKPGGRVVSVAGPPDADMRAKFAGSALLKLGMWAMARGVYARAAAKGAKYFRFLTESDGTQLRAIATLVDAGAIRPVIDRHFPFAQAIEAFEYLEAGRAKGKVVLDCGSRLGGDALRDGAAT
jgi:alcohol dehydrogenase